MATRTLAEPTLWDAGQRLMMVANPDAWAGIVAAGKIAGDNREALDGCRKTALKAKKAVRCTIEIKTAD